MVYLNASVQYIASTLSILKNPSVYSVHCTVFTSDPGMILTVMLLRLIHLNFKAAENKPVIDIRCYLTYVRSPNFYSTSFPDTYCDHLLQNSCHCEINTNPESLQSNFVIDVWISTTPIYSWILQSCVRMHLLVISGDLSHIFVQLVSPSRKEWIQCFTILWLNASKHSSFPPGRYIRLRYNPEFIDIILGNYGRGLHWKPTISNDVEVMSPLIFIIGDYKWYQSLSLATQIYVFTIETVAL